MEMKKNAVIAIAAIGLVGVANAATIFNAAEDNTTLVDNGVATVADALTLTEISGDLVLTNGNGAFNMGGFASTSDINTLQGTPLTDNDTVTIKLTVESVSPIANLRANGIAFGMVYDPVFGETAATAPLDNLIIGAEAANSGSDIFILNSSFQDVGVTGSPDATDAGIADGFTVTLTANAAGYTFLLEGLNASATPITVSGSFAGDEFLTYFGTGHFYYVAQKWNGSGGSTPAALVSVISEASITVETQVDPVLAVAPSTLSLELFAPDTTTNGTIVASYYAGLSTEDIEVVSLVADAGFSASMVSSTLGLGNTDEELTVTFDNSSIGLTNFGDTTNSTLVITWTVDGSGVTNTTEAALDVTYIPVSPEPPVVEHGAIVFEAATTNTTLVSNDYGGGTTAANVHLSGASPNLVLTNDGPNLFMGGFASSDTIETLAGVALTDEDTVVMTMTVDSLDGAIRANGIEFGLAEEPVFRGGGSSNLIVSVEAGDNNDVKIWTSFQDDGDTGYKVTDASLYDGFGLSLTANVDGYTFLITDVETGTGTNWISISGTFDGNEFLDHFGGGHFYYAAQKHDSASLVSTISDASLSVSATVAGKFVGSSVSNGNLVMEFTGSVGRGYLVETTENLTIPDSWETATNITSLPESPMTVSWPTTNAAAFYRIVTP
jgi:hypothetical protein